jgi:RNA polymerase sigma-70 factor, ECF subfamily
VGSYSSKPGTDDLLERCCNSGGNTGAWEEFVSRYHRLIASVALHTAGRLGDSSSQTVDDLIQETYLKLCHNNFKLLRSFRDRHEGAFLGYIQVVTANVVRDHFKSLRALKRGSDKVRDTPEYFAPVADENSAGSATTIEREVLMRDIQRCLEIFVVGSQRERNCRIFWLYYRAGMTAEAIAALPGMDLHADGVQTIISRITRDLRKRLSTPRQLDSREIRGSMEGIRQSESF